jgi:hypothetical protein
MVYIGTVIAEIIRVSIAIARMVLHRYSYRRNNSRQYSDRADGLHRYSYRRNNSRQYSDRANEFALI